MTFKRNHMKWGVIAVMLGAILAVHYFTYLAHGNMRYEHSIHRMLLYLPLVLGSVWFGLKGALCVAAAVIVCNLPYAILSWQGLTPEDFDILRSLYSRNRIMNLRKLFPHIPESLNTILMHFAQGAEVFYETTKELLGDLRGALRDLTPS